MDQIKDLLKRKCICETYVLTMPVTIKVGMTNVGNQARPLKYSEQSCICYQFRAHSPMYDHRPQYIANIDEAEIVVCAQHCQASTGSCFLNDTGIKSPSKSTGNK
jgi:hypothetical protein